jgi:hypothetical protein
VLGNQDTDASACGNKAIAVSEGSNDDSNVDGDVKFEKRPYADIYTGTAGALIAQGICKPDWFPVHQDKDSQGRTRRTFRATHPEHGRGVTLTQRRRASGERYWVVMLDLPDDEVMRRLDQRDMEWEEASRRLRHEMGPRPGLRLVVDNDARGDE